MQTATKKIHIELRKSDTKIFPLADGVETDKFTRIKPTPPPKINIQRDKLAPGGSYRIENTIKKHYSTLWAK